MSEDPTPEDDVNWAMKVLGAVANGKKWVEPPPDEDEDDE